MPEAKGFLIDLGGVVYQGDAALPGSLEAIRMLRARNVPFRYLTNTTSRPKARIVEKLAAIGISVGDDELFTPAVAARTHIARHGLDPHYLMAPELEEDFRDIETGATPAVIVGDARDRFTYSNLNGAFRRLEAGAELIALASNRKFVDEHNRISLDVGAFVAALEFGSGRKATVLGKPSPDFFLLAVESMDLAPGEVAMIGDDAEFDASAAVRAGLIGVLVRTGKWQPGAADGLDPPPTAEFEDLRQAVTGLLPAG